MTEKIAGNRQDNRIFCHKIKVQRIARKGEMKGLRDAGKSLQMEEMARKLEQ